jgi:hypothetical protein
MTATAGATGPYSLLEGYLISEGPTELKKVWIEDRFGMTVASFAPTEEGRTDALRRLLELNGGGQ